MRIILILLCVLSSLSLPSLLQAKPPQEQTIELPNYLVKQLKIEKNKITHLVFIDLWRSYEGQGDELIVANLPQPFLAQSQQIWLQPEMNVTQAQLTEFQQYFPNIAPLILDRSSKISRLLNVWQSPFHVLLKNNKQIFSGNKTALVSYITKQYPDEKTAIKTLLNMLKTPSETAHAPPTLLTKMTKQHKPLVGDQAPQFSHQSILGKQISLSAALDALTTTKPLSVIFIDSLCPMPHFPNCEVKLKQLNELVSKKPDRHWVGVINSYYVTEQSAKKFVQDFGINIPLFFDQDNAVFKAYDVYATPYQVDINRDGFIIKRSDTIH